MRTNYDVKFVTEQNPMQAQLTFRAHSVICDNYTASYIWLSDAGRFVAPFTQGFVAPLNGCQTADVRWITPPGIVPPTASTGTAQVTFTEGEVPPSSGTQVVVPSQQVPCPITSVLSLVGGATATVGGTVIGMGFLATSAASVIVALQAGANSIIITGGFVGAVGRPTQNITISGVESGTVYFDTVLAGNSANDVPGAAVVSSAADQHLLVTIGRISPSAFLSTFQVIASFGTQAVFVEGNPGSVPVSVVGVGGGPVLVQGPTSTSGLVPTTSFANSVSVNASLAAGASTTLLAAGSMKEGCQGGFITANNLTATGILQIQDSVGAVVYQFSYNTGVPWCIVPAFRTQAGDGGISLKNGGNVAQIYTGILTYV